MNNLYKFYIWFVLKFFKKKVVFDFHKYCKEKHGHVLLYYKTDPLFFSKLAGKCSHPNNWEILEMLKVLNKMGFWVDVIDRSIDVSKIKLKDKYDIFIGIGGGGSGRHYSEIASKLKKPIKIFFATTQETSVYNNALRKRYEYFSKRHFGKKLQHERMMKEIDKAKMIDNIDIIFSIGNDYTMNTFKDYKKPIYRIYPSTSSEINVDLKCFYEKDSRKFLYFGGNGNILKGLDLLIEAFSQLPDLELYICTVAKEKEFNLFYKDNLSKCKNIHWLGPVQVGKDVFNKITSECAYVVLPSSTEGTATSVVTCMRRGLIPVVTPEAGIDIKDFGYLIDSIDLDQLSDKLISVSKNSGQDLIQRSVKSYLASFKYTQAGFSKNFEEILIDILVKNNKIKK
jgi:glycosyltransferase involved in cell wall biosynthesis